MAPGSTRRAFLRSSVPLLGSALAGCSSFDNAQTKLTLTLLNFTPQSRRMYVELLRTDRDEREGAVVLNREYDLPPDTDDEVGHVEDPNVVPSRRYLVRVELLDPEISDHHHFYPSCTGEDGAREKLFLEVHPWLDDDPNDGPYFDFRSGGCGGSSGPL